jgi:hypothetical protein
MIKPEIGKLPKSLVDRIPLVMYIPPPPAGSAQEKLTIPEPALSYPPKPVVPSPPPPKTRFRFIRSLSSFKGKKKGTGANSPPDEKIDEHPGEPQTWEEHWEQGEYPFVVLEGNRAACAICLMDFEEPKRIGGLPSNVALSGEQGKYLPNQDSTFETPDTDKGAGSTQPVRPGVDIAEEDRQENLKLEDAGDGAQPLRLLACGHVFHVSIFGFLSRSYTDTSILRKHV